MTTRYFYDTEFIENGTTIDLISIGIVADDGREYYAVSEEVNDDGLKNRIRRHDWLMKHVVPHLPLNHLGIWTFTPPSNEPPMFSLNLDATEVKNRRQIRNEVREFLLGGQSSPELWAYYSAYDHVALCQLFGTMIQLPKGMPMFTHELMQLWEDAGRPEKPQQTGNQHNALEDARWNRDLHKACSDSP